MILEDGVLPWVACERPPQQPFMSRGLSALWTRVNLGARTLSSKSSLITPYPSPSHRSVASAARCCCSHLDRFYLHHPVASQRRVRLNGSSRANLSAVRDDRARAGQWLDAVPETERQAPQTSSWTTAALKVCVCVLDKLRY